jgi:hypothetical protein
MIAGRGGCATPQHDARPISAAARAFGQGQPDEPVNRVRI